MNLSEQQIKYRLSNVFRDGFNKNCEVIAKAFEDRTEDDYREAAKGSAVANFAADFYKELFGEEISL